MIAKYALFEKGVFRRKNMQKENPCGTHGAQQGLNKNCFSRRRRIAYLTGDTGGGIAVVWVFRGSSSKRILCESNCLNPPVNPS